MILNLNISKNNSIKTLLFVVLMTGLFLLTAQQVQAQVIDILAPVKDFILDFVFTMLTGIPSILVWASGLLLNMSLYYLVVEMGNLINNQTELGYVINSLWAMVRDTLNIFLIFGLIYIGFKTILNSEDSGTRKALAQLIGAALLINFSLFIAKTIIDFANIIAVQIYNLMTSMSGVDSSISISNFGYYGVSGAFMDLLGILNFSTETESFTSDNFSLLSGVVFAFVAMIFLTVTALIFAAGAFMLIARFVALIFYMIFSPFMFLGWVLPAFRNTQSDWWKGFFKKAFFAPAYIFLLYLSYASLYRFSLNEVGGGGNGDLASVFISGASGTNSFEIVVYFTVAAGLLIGSIIVAQKMSIVGADTTMNGLNGIKNAATGAVNNRLNSYKSAAYRATMGRYYKDRLDRMDDLDRQAQAGDTKAKRKLRTMTLASGYASTNDMRAATEKAKNYGAGGGMGIESHEKADRERKSKTARANKVQEIIDVLEDNNKSEAEKMAILDQASVPQLVDIAKKPKYKELMENNAHLISSDKLKKMSESDDVDDDLADLMSNKKYQHTKDKYNNNPEALSSANKEDLKSLGVEYLSEKKNAVQLSEDKIDKIDMIEPYKDQIKQARKEALIEVAEGASFGNFDADKMLKQDLTKLPDGVFGDNVFTKKLSVSHLQNLKKAEVKKAIRPVLEAERRRVGGGNNARLDDIDEWFTFNSTGQLFGK